MKIEIAEIERWSPRPGDRLIVRVGQMITNEQADLISSRVRAVLQLPAGFPILVAGPGISVSVGTL